ncbi:hypothetical protein EVJ58_g1512 [Rhodofomes roseus]|uniref:Uncharacterized protein n=1 Tax=Rhodofomes roseus TaxID=34475 RepID=A0A4Y9YZ16_9APHY|nr:hypothetical protein EVJ58_g1512 [Rhodofomes roseus]
MSSSKGSDVKPNDTESNPQVAPPTLPEIEPTKPLSETIEEEDDFDDWKPRGPVKTVVAGNKGNAVRR